MIPISSTCAIARAVCRRRRRQKRKANPDQIRKIMSAQNQAYAPAATIMISKATTEA